MSIHQSCARFRALYYTLIGTPDLRSVYLGHTSTVRSLEHRHFCRRYYIDPETGDYAEKYRFGNSTSGERKAAFLASAKSPLVLTASGYAAAVKDVHYALTYGEYDTFEMSKELFERDDLDGGIRAEIERAHRDIDKWGKSVACGRRLRAWADAQKFITCPVCETRPKTVAVTEQDGGRSTARGSCGHQWSLPEGDIYEEEEVTENSTNETLGDLMKMLVDFEFEGKKLFIFEYKGRKCCLVPNLGEVLGYSDADSFGSSLRQWSSVILDGEDKKKVEGEDYTDLKAVLDLTPTGEFDPTESVGSKLLGSMTRRVTILFEGGIWAACMKTDKPVGDRVINVLKREVFPRMGAGYTAEQIGAGASPQIPDTFSRRELVSAIDAIIDEEDPLHKALRILKLGIMTDKTPEELMTSFITGPLLPPPAEKPVARLHDHQREHNPDQWRSVGDMATRFDMVTNKKGLYRLLSEELNLYRDEHGRWVLIDGLTKLDMNEEHDSAHLRYPAGVVYLVLSEMYRIASLPSSKRYQHIKERIDKGIKIMWPLSRKEFVTWAVDNYDRMPVEAQGATDYALALEW